MEDSVAFVAPVTMILVMSDTLPLAEVKAKLSEMVDRVEHQHDRITVTRNGRPAAVLVSPDDLASLEDTLDLLSNPTRTRGDRTGPQGSQDRQDTHRRAAPGQVPDEVTQPDWDLTIAATVERQLARLPGRVAPAIVEFLLGPLSENPHRVGHPLRRSSPVSGQLAVARIG